MTSNRLLRTVLLGCTLAALIALPAHAEKDDKLVAGGTVRQTEPVAGDLVAFGGDVELLGEVKGDAILGGGNVRTRGTIGNDLYAGAGNVLVGGQVGGSAHVGAGNATIARDAVVGGDVHVAAGDLDVEGTVGGSIHVAAGNLRIDATVHGDVHAATGDITLGPNARIGGTLYHRGGAITRAPGAEVAGIERGRDRSARSERAHRQRSEDGGWGWSLFVIVLSGLLAAALPSASRMVDELRAAPAISVLAGFIALVCLPVIAVVLMITLIGLPVALIVLLLYALLLLAGYALSGVLLGNAALRRLRAADAARAGWRIGAAMVAMFLIALFARIPFVGGLVVFGAMIVGIGAIVMAFKRSHAVSSPA